MPSKSWSRRGCGDVIFKQKEKERVEKRNQNRGKEERGKAVFLLKSGEKWGRGKKRERVGKLLKEKKEGIQRSSGKKRTITVKGNSYF
ncbi:MAG: hypothetical protein GY705_27330 [Bacteroidetes bacterium]|nr:hypothetical protein [Bacteroidota bacterium]